MELRDFEEKSSSIDDFDAQPKSETGASLNSKTTSQVAASVVLTKEEPTLDGYKMLRDSLESRQGREAFLLENDMQAKADAQGFAEDLPSILMSDTVTDEGKMAALDIVRNNYDVAPRSTIDFLSRAGIMAEVEDEDEDSFISRSLIAETLGPINQLKREQQELLNAYYERRKDEKGENHLIKDLGEILVPFAEFININDLLREFGEDPSGAMGQQKEQLYNIIKSLPLSERITFTKRVIELVDQNDTVIFPDGNDLVAFETLERMLIDNDYSSFEKWFDNTTSVLEVIGVGTSIAAVAKTASRSKRAAEIAKRASRTEVSPTSPSQVMKDTNPEKARNMNKLVAEDETGEAAKALHGTTKDEALAKDHLPEPEVRDGKTEHKVDMSGPQFPEPEEVKVVRTRDGETYVTEAEVAKAKETVLGDAESVEGFRLQKESTKIKLNDDGSSTFSFMWRPRNSGWATATKAIENATYATRDFGTTADDFKLYVRDGKGEWNVTTQKEIDSKKKLRDEFTRKKKKIPAELKEIDYAVGMDYNHRFSPDDIDNMFDKMPVSRLNQLDKLDILGVFKGQRGSLTQHIIPPRSLLDSDHVVGPAAAAIDRGMRLRRLFTEQFIPFAKSYQKLGKQDRARMSDYINEANLEGIRFNPGDLKARGFKDKHIKMLRQWRKANDTLYHAANADMAKSLRLKGRKILTDGNENTLVVTPMKRGSVGPRTKFYDPTDGKMKTWKDASYNKTLDEFYEEGGSFVRLETPIEVDGKWIDRAISYDNPKKGYLRSIRDDETVLAYREGYYPVMYDANFIIKKKMRDVDGNEFNKAVGTSLTREDAVRAANKLNEDEGKELFFIDADRRSKIEKAQGVISGEAYEAATSYGLSFQRSRGQRLFDAGNNLHKTGHTNLLDPLEAVSRQIGALSERVSIRGYLETTKSRILANYKGKVEFPKDKAGKDLYPTDVSDIKRSTNGSMQDVADAKSMFNYVYSLENGFINQIVDVGFKGAINGLADIMEDIPLAGKKLSGGMKAMQDAQPSQKLKGAAFKLFLAGNPQRQIVVQSSQVNQLWARFPTYMGKGGLMKDLHKVNMAKIGLSKDPEALKMLDEIRKAGFTVAVDANNLVRSESMRLADLKISDKAKSALEKPVKLGQRVGFDVGEQFVLITSWLAHRAEAASKGKKLTARDYEKIAGDARAYTWDMNKAGDMPYTGNEFNVVFQFLQVPHKASMQPLTDKSLTKMQRAQLLGWNTAVYGIPTVILPTAVTTALYDLVGEDSELVPMINDGMLDYMLNGLLTVVSGEQQAISFADFKPTDIYGTANLAASLLTTDLSSLIAEAPAGSLLFGNNPRITNFAKTTAKWVVPALDYNDPENQVNYKDVVKEGASLFSGFSNAFKMQYAIKTNQKRSGLGNITDDDVTDIEAAFQFFGFRTKTEEGVRKAKELIYEGGEFQESDVQKWYAELKRVLSLKGITPQERDFHQRVLSEGWAAFEEWEFDARQALLNAVDRDMKKGVYDFAYDIVQNSGGRTPDEVREIIMQLPESELRTNLLRDLDRIDESIERWKH